MVVAYAANLGAIRVRAAFVVKAVAFRDKTLVGATVVDRGDYAHLVRGARSDSAERARDRRATPVANGSVQLTLDANLPAGLASGFGMTFAGDSARGGGSTIEHNVVPETVFGRGIWIGGAAGVTIQDNNIGNTSNGGIVVYQSTKAFPGPPAHDITIQRNKLNGSLGPMASGTAEIQPR